MLQQSIDESIKVGVKMNLSKTKSMTNIDDKRNINVGDTVIERVDNYGYFEHKLN